MTGPSSRRGFLSGLVSLPLIGGGITLIGTPSAVAEPVTPWLLRNYESWLAGERRRVLQELYSDAPPNRLNGVDVSNPGWWFHHHVPDYRTPAPSTRAATVLAAAGCDWREHEL